MWKRIVGFVVGLTTTALLVAAPANAETRAPRFTLNVVHGIPGLTVDVCVDGEKAVTKFTPGDVVTGVRLTEGVYRLRVTATGDPCSAALLKARASLEGGWNRNYTVVANLDDEGRPNLLTPPQPFRSEFLEKHYLSKE